MFVRTRIRKLKQGSSSYAYLVDNDWNTVKKKHEQKIIACLGPTDRLPHDGTIEKMIIALDHFAQKQGFSSLSGGTVIPRVTEGKNMTACYDWGIVNLTKQTLKNLSLDKIISGSYAKATGRKTISPEKFLAAVTALFSHRFIPQTEVSERATLDWYTNGVFLPNKQPLLKDDFYRTLDILLNQKEFIEKSYYEQNLDLFSGKLDLVLFDTTSIYYYGAEGEYDENSILQYGFSKDGKSNLKQVIVGILMTSDGIPIAHEVFPGNTADVTSFSRMITLVKDKYPVGKIILIADRGMVSEDNLVHLEQSGLSYIVGIRMRLLPQTLKRKLLVPLDEEEEKYELEFMDKSSNNLYVKEFPVSKLSDDEINDLFVEKIKKGKSATFDEAAIREQIRKRRFFICLNPYVKEAVKKKREFFTRIIERKISTAPTKEWVIKNGYKKYLKFEKGLTPTVDYDRLRDEEIYDGKWIIMTNEKNLSSFMAGEYYKTLQNIERGFKDLKSLINVRPIYHFKEERIKAHVFVCFLVLVIKWYICRIINQYSQEEGRKFIGKMISLKAIDANKELSIYVRTDIDKETQMNMKKFSMKIPGKVIFSPLTQPIPITHKGGRLRKNQPLLPGISFTV
jgi:transposase